MNSPPSGVLAHPEQNPSSALAFVEPTSANGDEQMLATKLALLAR
jgi:hypothetical protein